MFSVIQTARRDEKQSLAQLHAEKLVALTDAIRTGSLDELKNLAKQHGDALNVRSKDSNLAILAVKTERADFLQHLFNEGVNTHVQSSSRETLWHLAVRRQNAQVLDVLARGCRPNTVVDNTGQSVLDIAIQLQNQPTVELLLAAGFRKFNLFAATKSTDLFTLLVRETHACIYEHNAQGQSLLHAVCRHGNAVLAQSFLAEGFNVNLEDAAGLTPLHHAIQQSNLQLVMLLVNNRALVNRPKRYFAPRSPFPPMLHEALKSGNLAIIQCLLKSGADPNVADAAGRNAINFACSLQASNLVLLDLLDAGSDPAMSDRGGTSAASRLVEAGNVTVLTAIFNGQHASKALALPPIEAYSTLLPSCSCPICKETMIAGDAFYSLTCRHHFHKDCLSEWMGTSVTCPLCGVIIPVASTDAHKYIRKDARLSWRLIVAKLRNKLL